MREATALGHVAPTGVRTSADRARLALSQLRTLSLTPVGRRTLRDLGVYVRLTPTTVRMEIRYLKLRGCRNCGADITDRDPRTRWCRSGCKQRKPPRPRPPAWWEL